MNNANSTGGEPQSPRWHFQPRTIAVIAVVWMLLWGELSVFLAATGVLIGLLITWAFPLPPIRFAGRVRPLRLLLVGLALVLDLVVASWHLTKVILQPGRCEPRSAIIKVQLRSDSDLYQTLIVELVSLVPGSVVVEARRTTRTLYLHVFDVRGPNDYTRARNEVLTAERRVLWALGSKAEQAALRSADAPGAAGSKITLGVPNDLA